MTKLQDENHISVTINGKRYAVPLSFSSTTLNDYLRVHLRLTGTKVMCREGGCGVCIVHAAIPNPGTGQSQQFSVNSCLVPVLSCDGWEITTVEGIGNQKTPHPVQQQITDHYGSQCGYCTPGMVMSMYSLLQGKNGKTLTEKEVEKHLDGNICRCTGYRPILDAFKTFACDGTNGKPIDMEDIASRVCVKTGKQCHGLCDDDGKNFVRPLPESIRATAPEWHKPASLPELYKLLPQMEGKKAYLACGRTGVGVYNEGPYDAFVDLRGIKELFHTEKGNDVVVVGAGVPLTNVIALFHEVAQAEPGFRHLEDFATLISKTAHPAVRNIGSWGGNISMKHRHPEFPSDTFVALVMSDARIIIGPDEKSFSPEEFLKLDMKNRIVLRMELRPFDASYVFRTFKVMHRTANSHAYVNAAFRAKLDRAANKFTISERPVLAFGNISAEFVRAEATEAFVTGKDLGDNEVMQRMLSGLQEEIKPDAHDQSEASPDFKRSLSTALLYKFALQILGNGADARYRSAVSSLDEIRPVSSGKQSYPTTEKEWPLTKPIPKMETMVQSTGEARFISDIEREGLLHAAFALSTEGHAKIQSIDTAAARAAPGVIRVFTAKDIPGENNTANHLPGFDPEELLASTECKHYGQPLALVVAVTKEAAEEGAFRVKVTYTDVKPVVVSCKDAVTQGMLYEKEDGVYVGDADKAIGKAKNKVIGEFELGTQFHFHMETMVCVAVPTEEGLDLEAGTQWIDGVQDAVHQVTGIEKNAINVTVKRNGGGFGAKITRNNPVSAATALAAFLLQRPVKMHQSIWDNMKCWGKRFPYYVKYEAGFDDEGKLEGVKLAYYNSAGIVKTGENPLSGEIKKWFDNAYKCANWSIDMTSCKTNVPSNVSCRAPGSTEAIYTIEHVMEHVAHSLGKPPIDIKRLNFYSDGDKVLDGSKIRKPTLKPITEQLLKESDYHSRLEAVEAYNKNNRWKKRAISVVPLRYGAQWNDFKFSCLISVYHNGGYVAVSHGGIEIGQGINTKVAQVVAHELGIDLKYVLVQPAQAIISANNYTTGGSVTSELCCMAAIEACKELLGRLNPIKKVQKSDAVWETIVEACFLAGVDLTARGFVAPKSTEQIQYSTYGCMVTEVELDILTGEHQISRLDVLYDCGDSLSPLIDIGQVEGAIIMGLGYYTTEEVIYDTNTGENLTPGTWKYKPFLARDIPLEFNVSLLHDHPNPHGVLRSKISAEPPLNMTCSVVFALRDAIGASHADSGHNYPWFDFVNPMTVERLQLYCKNEVADFRYKD